MQLIDDRCAIGECKHKGSYYVPVECTNCDWKGWMQCTKGHEPTTLTHDCPRCGCSTIERDDSRKMAFKKPRR